MIKYSIGLKILPQYVHLYPECVNGIKTIFASSEQYSTAEDAKKRFEELFLGILAESVTVQSEEIDLQSYAEDLLRNYDERQS